MSKETAAVKEVNPVNVEPVKAEPKAVKKTKTANKANKNNKNVKAKVEKEYLLTNESFKRINQTQAKIEEVTGFKPSFKRLVNEALSEESVKHLESRLISKLT
jgi:hypothetical protein